MQPIIRFSDSIKNQFAVLKVEAVILFGSRATGTARLTSDIDIGVIVPVESHTLQKHRAVYDLIYDYLSDQIDQQLNFDIVFLDDASLELQVHTMRNGIVLYEGKNHAFADFKERVMRQAADFAPYRTLFEQSTLARI